MVPLADVLARASTHPRALPWRLKLHAGWSRSAEVRSYLVVAAAEDAGPVTQRLHNTILLLGPAAAELDVDLPLARVAPHLAALRALHHVPISFREPPEPGATAGLDVPAKDAPFPEPPGPGLAAGLDIGGTGIKACVLRDGRLLRARSAPTWPEGEYGVASLIRRCRDLLRELAAGEAIGSLGIGLAAPMGVGGRVLDLSTVLRERVGEVAAFDGFAERIAEGLVAGPVAQFNDLANLGRHLSATGGRRMVRLQVGTSFGGCWIDANGEVAPVEMGRLVVDVGPDALPHPYLPLRGAMRSYLSNQGLARVLGPRAGHPVDPRTAGHLLRGLLDDNDPEGEAIVRWMAELILGVVAELLAVLPGIARVEIGGSPLLGPAGRRLEAVLAGRGGVPITVAALPGFDGVVAAAMAPRLPTALRGTIRLGPEPRAGTTGAS